MIELDLLIIGGYYGEGKRRGDVSHFLLGLLKKGNLFMLNIIIDFSFKYLI